MKLLIIALIAFLLLLVPVKAAITAISLTDDTVFDMKGKMWIIDWSAVWEDYVSASKTKEEIKSMSGYDAETGFTLEISSADEWARYALPFKRGLWTVEIRESPAKALGWSKADEDKWIAESCSDINLDGSTDALGLYNFFGWKMQMICFHFRAHVGTINSIGTPVGIFRVDWKFTPTGKSPVTTTISNENNVGAGVSTSLYLGATKVGIIRWGGSFVTGVEPPKPIGILASWNKETGAWNLFDIEHYNALLVKVDMDGYELLKKYSAGEITKEVAEGEINGLVGKMLYTWTTNSEFPRTLVSFLNEFMKRDLPERVYIPSFVLNMDGDYYLKVIVPGGIPKIVDMAMPEIMEDGKGTVELKVQNIAEQKGQFEASLSCYKAQVVTPTQIVGISPKETKSILFDIIGGKIVTAKESYSCTASVKDAITGKTDSMTKEGLIDKRAFCKVGDQTVAPYDSLWAIYEYTDIYCTKKLVEVCKPGEYPEWYETRYVCHKPPVPPPVVCPPNTVAIVGLCVPVWVIVTIVAIVIIAVVLVLFWRLLPVMVLLRGFRR